MPPLSTAMARLVWIAAQFLALAASDSAPGNYPVWQSYLMTSTLLSACYWPEIEGWSEVFWPGILLVVLLRGAAALEALHRETGDFPYWPRMMGGVFLLATGGTAIVWRMHDGTALEVIVQFKRYAQIWTALTMIITLGLWWVVGNWRARWTGVHACILLALTMPHAAISLLFLAGPRSDGLWANANLWITWWDALCYLAWFFAALRRGAVPHDRQPAARGIAPPRAYSTSACTFPAIPARIPTRGGFGHTSRITGR